VELRSTPPSLQSAHNYGECLRLTSPPPLHRSGGSSPEAGQNFFWRSQDVPFQTPISGTPPPTPPPPPPPPLPHTLLPPHFLRPDPIFKARPCVLCSARRCPSLLSSSVNLQWIDQVHESFSSAMACPFPSAERADASFFAPRKRRPFLPQRGSTAGDPFFSSSEGRIDRIVE